VIESVMGNTNIVKTIHKVLVVVLVAAVSISMVEVVKASHATVDLGTADDFAILAGSTITDANPSVITGDVGLSPASGAFIDVTCAEVDGDIYAVDAAGPAPCSIEDGPLLVTAKDDLTTAYNDAAGRLATGDPGTELGGDVLTDGTYETDSGTFEIAAGQTLTLDGEGNEDAVFIFNMTTTLVTFANSNVELINGAQACNVFWRVGSSATLGTGTDFIGTIMADQSITDNGGSTVEGRLLARIAAVNLDDTTVTRSDCAEVTEDGEDGEDGEDTTDDGSGSGSDDDTAPGLPNAGIGPGQSNTPWNIIVPAAATTASLSLYLVRKKWII
jgi:hypothetical protein